MILGSRRRRPAADAIIRLLSLYFEMEAVGRSRQVSGFPTGIALCRDDAFESVYPR